MKDLSDAFERIAAGAEERAGLDAAALGPVLAETGRRRHAFAARSVGAVAGVAAAAVLVATLVQLDADRLPPVGPDPSSPAPTETAPTTETGQWPSAVTVAAIPGCEDPAPVVDAPTDPVLSLTMREPDGAALADQRVDLAPEVAATEDFWAVIAGDVTYVLVAREGEYAGRVVAVASVDPGTGSPVGPAPRGNGQLRARTVAFASCIPGLRPHTDETQVPRSDIWLPDGTYDAYVIAPLRAYLGDGITYGGPDVLLLAGGPTTVTLSGLLPTPTAAPDLPDCGESTATLVATTVGPLSARSWYQRLDGSATFAPILDDRGPTPFTDVRWSRIDWVIGRDGVAVAAGALDTPAPQDPATVLADGSAYVQDSVTLAGLADCRTGRPLADGGPVEVWTRSVLTLDLTPAEPGDADASVSLLAAPLWFTFDPAPVPSGAPVLGAGQPADAGVDGQSTDQTGEHQWVVQQSWTEGATYGRLTTALLAAGFTLTQEELQRTPDGPGTFNYVWATFTGQGWTYELSGGNDTGGGWLASWTLTQG